MMLEEIYCYVDDFHKKYSSQIEKSLITTGIRKRNRPSQLTIPEVITIMILFHQSHYRNFKHFYLNHVHKYLKQAFPKLVSYNRFVELQSRCLIYRTCCDLYLFLVEYSKFYLYCRLLAIN